MESILTDSEYTTWPGALESGWTLPQQHREIVQLAAIKVDQEFNEVASLELIIRPTINPELSKLFIELTGITQKRVDTEGMSFKDGLAEFFSFCESGKIPVGCMNADEAVMRENCRLNNVPFPYSMSWHRLRPFLETLGIDTNAYSSGDLHKLTPVPLTGHTHNALHDVRSKAHWMKYARLSGLLASIRDLPTGAPTTDPRSKLATKSLQL